ncbi:phage portal protein [Paenibacillus sp. GCM10027626]|uniref:phage tail assembly chaperone n=1 Tax=Paenibacillus sp. GCM10027626 TaxID=3273411 RepID=UPI003629D293
MSDLSVFFAGNAAVEVTEDVVISPRFKDKKGNAVPWKIRSMTEDENEQCRKAATKKVKTKNGQYVPETDYNQVVVNTVVTSVVFPNLKDAELQKSYGVVGADELLKKMLLPGEYAALVQKVQDINGYDREMNELVDEVKN